MDLHLSGKIALVTAASSGIGFAVAKRLVVEGVTVVVNARKGTRLDQAVGQLRDLAPNGADSVFGYAADLTEDGAARAAVRDAVADLGHLDIVVSNTAGPPLTPLVEASDADWDHSYAMLLRPAAHLGGEAAKHMVERGEGSIIFMTSSWAKQPAPNAGLSSSMRSAIAAMAKSLANEVVGRGVRVNQVMPGATATDRMKQLTSARARRNGTTVEDEVAAAVAAVPMGRWADPEEIADSVVFLASPRSSFTTGQALVVDGGSVRSIL